MQLFRSLEVKLIVRGDPPDGVQVEVVLTEDDWKTIQRVGGYTSRDVPGPFDEWTVEVPARGQVKFAAVLRVNGEERWDNAYGADVRCGDLQPWGSFRCSGGALLTPAGGP